MTDFDDDFDDESERDFDWNDVDESDGGDSDGGTEMVATMYKDADTFEILRRMAYGLCEYCGKDYTDHRSDPQSSCDPKVCEREAHCHESDFKCATDDPTLLSRDQLRVVYDALPASRRKSV